MTRRVYRHDVPVDDQWHTYQLLGPIIAVGPTGADDTIEFWVLNDDTGTPDVVHLRVFGTGQPLEPDTARWVGTCRTLDRVFAWHLFRLTP